MITTARLFESKVSDMACHGRENLGLVSSVCENEASSWHCGVHHVPRVKAGGGKYQRFVAM